MSWNEFSPYVRHLSVRERNRVRDAYELGFKVHDGQLRKSGEPFFTHPVIVAQILSAWGADADTLIAALLHDSVEDTPLTLEEVEAQFGGAVETLIEGVTKLSAEEFAHKPTLNEATETLRKMFTLMERDVRIIVIKLADRLHNMQTIHFLKPDRQQAIAQETLDIYARVAEQLSMQDLRVQLEELSLKILDAPLHESLRTLRDSNELKGIAMLETLEQTLKTSPFSSPSIRMMTEHKTWEMLRQQWETAGAPVTGVPSVIIAIVCKSVPDCYYMLGTLHQLWQRESLSFQDYINSPLLNGYRGLHTTIILEDGTRVRCKIRTEEMQEYTKRGITMHCFDSRADGQKMYLPWTQRISPLAEDTREKSGEFWKGLQTDILGASIPIHGPGGKMVMLPKGSTALDGAFFLMEKDTLRMQSIKINGQEVSPQTQLNSGDTLSISLGEELSVKREWLLWVSTGLATAIIRSGLSLASPEEKLMIGREMLQQLMQQRHKGLLQEFDENQLLARAKERNYDSLQHIFTQIADGHLSASEAYVLLFGEKRSKSEQKPQAMTIAYSLNVNDERLMGRVDVIYRRFSEMILEIHCLRKNDQQHCFVKMRISSIEAQEVMEELKRAGATDLRLISAGSKAWAIAAVTVLVTLWGTDPLAARVLLQQDIEPFGLTVGRFLTCLIAGIIIQALSVQTSREKLKPLNPLKQQSLALAGLSLAATALLTYLTLKHLPASQYILFILSGQLITTLLKNYAQRRIVWRNFLSFFFVACSIIVLLQIQQHSMLGLLYAIGASVSFAVYSQISESYQRSIISTRYPAYLTWVSLISLTGCALLIPVFGLPEYSPLMLAKIVLFTLIFNFLPYVLYFETTRRLGRELLDHALPLTFLVTFVGEMLITQAYSLPLLTALLLLALPLLQTARQR